MGCDFGNDFGSQPDPKYVKELTKDLDRLSICENAAEMQMDRKKQYNISAKAADGIAVGVCNQIADLINAHPEHQPSDIVSTIAAIFKSNYMQRKLTKQLEFRTRKLTYHSKSQKKEVEREVCNVSIIDTLKQLMKDADFVDQLRTDKQCKQYIF